MGLISNDLLAWSLFGASIARFSRSFCLFLLLADFLWVVAIMNRFRLLLTAIRTKLGPIIFNIEFDSSKLYNITST